MMVQHWVEIFHILHLWISATASQWEMPELLCACELLANQITEIFLIAPLHWRANKFGTIRDKKLFITKLLKIIGHVYGKIIPLIHHQQFQQLIVLLASSIVVQNKHAALFSQKI